ncbi:unnamed protein product [Meloidogyne enterolobii]|uniref:Uncharacterized protein n=1 Tax=Meloidogyne enterolobii TaxID=390850 RepID=A0ACB1AIU5_MELEN
MVVVALHGGWCCSACWWLLCMVVGGCSTWWLVLLFMLVFFNAYGCWGGAGVNAGVVLFGAAVQCWFGGSRDLDGGGGASTSKNQLDGKMLDWENLEKFLGGKKRRGVSHF